MISNFKNLGLKEEILEALNKLSYNSPTDVQGRVIPMVLEGKDVIVKSQTGSGKTAAFGIPICEKVELEKRKPQVLILTPTRELAVQVKEELSNIGRYKKLRCAAVFGKQPIIIQTRELKQRVHIVVGTPGRTLDHINKETLMVEEIKYLVIDEADKMLNMGFIDQVEAIIKALPTDRITMLFSATIPKEIENLCKNYLKEPANIEVEHDKPLIEEIQQYCYMVENSDKFKFLNNIIYIERPESAIIFLNTKDGVDKLENNMKKKGYSCRAIHGGMEQDDRLSVMKAFKKGEFNYLIATDVAARGIHVEDITHVINYDLPVELESYVHRIGRTGRAGKKGSAITFVSQHELRSLGEIENYIGYKLTIREIPSEDEIKHNKQIYDKMPILPIKIKKDKSDEINSQITKLYINAGKSKKIRPGDIVGAIINIEGINIDDIGIIDVQDNISYVDILGNKSDIVLNKLQNGTLKGKKVRVQKAKA
jgi:ATP-dependent RNA helicase DeaD